MATMSRQNRRIDSGAPARPLPSKRIWANCPGRDVRTLAVLHPQQRGQPRRHGVVDNQLPVRLDKPSDRGGGPIVGIGAVAKHGQPPPAESAVVQGGRVDRVEVVAEVLEHAAEGTIEAAGFDPAVWHEQRNVVLHCGQAANANLGVQRFSTPGGKVDSIDVFPTARLPFLRGNSPCGNEACATRVDPEPVDRANVPSLAAVKIEGQSLYRLRRRNGHLKIKFPRPAEVQRGGAFDRRPHQLRLACKRGGNRHRRTRVPQRNVNRRSASGGLPGGANQAAASA